MTELDGLDGDLIIICFTDPERRGRELIGGPVRLTTQDRLL